MNYHKDPNEYPDWHIFNNPSGIKQPGRNSGDTMKCLNLQCPSGGVVSEHEAFYTFAKLPLFTRIFTSGLYMCPFCGSTQIQSNLAVDDPQIKELLRKHRIR